jgi:primary-amine oxidase
VSIKDNIWASLTLEEAVDIRSWLSKPDLGLNLTTGSEAKLKYVRHLLYELMFNLVHSDDFIELIETYYPPKSDALAYYNGTRPRPIRSARVVINHGGSATPMIRSYLVYPIPTTANTVFRPLNDIYHRPEIPNNAAFIELDTPDIVSMLTAGLDNVIPELFWGRMAGLPNDTLSAAFDGPWSFDGKFRRYSRRPFFLTPRYSTLASYY